MKQIVSAIALVLSLSLSNGWAERLRVGEPTGSGMGNSTNTTSVRYVKAPRFARPLVEKWISEYAKTEPGVAFQIVKGSQDNIDLNVVIEDKQTGTKDFSHSIVYFGETAVLPVTARSSEAARLLEGKHLNAKKLRQLFFLNDEFEEDTKKNKLFESLVVYSGSNASSVAVSFARHFGEESSSFRGKRIAGDDLFLNTALEKDPLGVSFNALPNIFDLGNRRVREGLTIIGLDLKKEQERTFSNEGTLDEILTILESGRADVVATGKVGISYSGTDAATERFLQWVLENGTRYNHEYGLQNLDGKTAQTEIEKVHTQLTAQK